MRTIAFNDGSTMTVVEAPHDDGSERLVDRVELVGGIPGEPVERDAGPGWVAVTAIERDPETGEDVHVARWIDFDAIASVS